MLLYIVQNLNALVYSFIIVDLIVIIVFRPQRLTNADFRKLLMTPRAPPGSQKETVTSTGTKTPGTEPPTQRRENKDDARAAERKKKKRYIWDGAIY